MKKNVKKKKTILVLEDERPLLEAITAKLQKSGFGVTTARSVEQAFNAKLDGNGEGVLTVDSLARAIQYLEELEQIDAVWLDHSLLGDEDGLDFVKKFKGNGGEWKKIPVFVVSNNENNTTVKAYMSAGVSKYYIKSNHRLDEIVKDIDRSLQ